MNKIMMHIRDGRKFALLSTLFIYLPQCLFSSKVTKSFFVCLFVFYLLLLHCKEEKNLVKFKIEGNILLLLYYIENIHY